MKATLYLVQVWDRENWVFDETQKNPLNLFKTQKHLRDLRLTGRTARIVEVSGIGVIVPDCE